MKKFNQKIIIILIIIIIISIIIIINKSFALEENNYKGDYILNHKWIEYMELSDEEKALYQIIPEKFIYQHKNEQISLFRLRNTYPSYYNLNDYGWSTYPEAQGSLGLCWAFAGLSSVETNMLKTGLTNINNYKNLSERQLDYVSVNSKHITEEFNPYSMAIRDYPGSGAYQNTAFVLMATGISPVTTEKFGEYNTIQEIKSLKEILNLNNIEYVVDEYINYGSIKEYSTDEERDSWVKQIKQHVMNYGSVAITSIGTLAGYGGSCLYKDLTNNYLINVRGECNPSDKNNIHAMAVIGWDDNYEYKYCRLNNETKKDLTNCTNIVSGKGAFILKNSWGNTYPYPYLAYKSNVDGAYGVTKVSQKNWDTNYDYTKTSESNYEYKISTITYHKSSQIKEKLEKISFYSNSRNLTNYDIYVSPNESDNYIKVDSIETNNIGLKTIYIDNIELEKEKFKIKIESDNGYIDQIYAFTSYIDKKEDIIIDTIIKTGTEYGKNIDNFSLYTVTKNIESGELIKYKFIDENNNDITKLVTIENNYSINNAVNPKIEINNTFPTGNIILQTIYKEKVYDTQTLTINNIKNLWSGGTGTIEDPFLIDKAEDFAKIFTNKDYLSSHYKIIKDLDFSNIKNWNIGSISNYQSFKGSLDGNNITISGLKGDSNLPSLFYSLESATIKNLIFENINWEIEESGWANLIAILAYNSTIENITITKTVEIKGKASNAGGIVATAYNSKFKNIANYANVTTKYAYHGKAAGIVVESYGCEITESYNYGNINATESIIGGITAYLDSYITTSSVGKIENVYNYGNLQTNLSGGGIAGYAKDSIINNTYNIFKTTNNKIANIVGTSYNMYIKDSYYLNNDCPSIKTDEENKSTLINVMGKTNNQLKEKTTYLNYNFDKIWTINNSYPYLKNINYYYLDDLKVEEQIELEIYSTKKLEITYSPITAINKKIEYKIKDDSIAIIDKEGNIKALKEGNTTLTINSLDGSNITKNIKIIVTKLDKINLDKYEIINNKYIIIKQNTTKDTFISNIYNGNKYKININNKNNFIATGDKIEIQDQFETKLEEYLTIILGDVTGTGTINVSDVAKAYQHIRKTKIMEEIFIIAADVVKDNELKVNDIAKLYQYVREKIESLEE